MKKKLILIISISIVIICAAVIAGLYVLFGRNGGQKEDNIGEIYCKSIDLEHVAMDNGMSYMDNEVLVVASEGVSKSDMQKLAMEYDAKIVGYIEITGDFQLELQDTYTKDELSEIIEMLADETEIESADYSYVLETEDNSVDYDVNYGDEWRDDMVTDDKDEGKSWGAKYINAPAAWSFLNEKKDEITPIRVGLIDSGFDEEHEDLGFAEVITNSEYNDHGTHVAGTMAASADDDTGICGIYPYGDGRLYATSRCYYNSYLENLSSLISYKCELAELIFRDVKVINLSFGYGEKIYLPIYYSKYYRNIDSEKEIKCLLNESNILANFLDRCLQKGYDFVLVSAAGNASNNTYYISDDDKDEPKEDYDQIKTIKTKEVDALYSSPLHCIGEDTYPAVYSRIIVVGAVGKEGKIYNKSCVGGRVDIYAPGEKIFSTVPKNSTKEGVLYSNYKYDDNNGMGWFGTGGNEPWNGTSMAAPHVSGTAAMVWTVNNNLTGTQVKKIITSSYNNVNGTKILDAEKAVKTAYDTNGENSTMTDAESGGAFCFVVDAENDEKIYGATVTAVSKEDGSTSTTVTDQTGHFELILAEGDYTITVTHPDYQTYTLDVTVKNEGVNYLSDWIRISKKDNLELYNDKYYEALNEIYENGILEECKAHFSSVQNGEWGSTESGNSDYSSGAGDFYYSICDIDGDGDNELLISWNDYYDMYSYGMKFIDILEYNAETDSFEHEAVIPFDGYDSNGADNKEWYKTITFYDNGTVIAKKTWFNVGQGNGAKAYFYNFDTDTYNNYTSENSVYEDYENGYNVNVWRKVSFPELNIYNDNYELTGTLTFPDEIDKDGDGILYSEMSDVEIYNLKSSDTSIWKDIDEIESLGVPDNSTEHIIAVNWYSLNDYIENGQENEYERSMDDVYSDTIDKCMYKYYLDITDTGGASSSAFYSESDINNDGVPELIIGEGTGADTEYSKIQIYTWVNNELYLLAYCNSDIPMIAYSICDDGIKYRIGSGTGSSAYQYYKLPQYGTKLEPVEWVGYESDPETFETRFYYNSGQYDYENGKEISEEEYNGICDNYKNIVLDDLSVFSYKDLQDIYVNR